MLDRILSSFAIAQAVLVSLRASFNLIERHNEGRRIELLPSELLIPVSIANNNETNNATATTTNNNANTTTTAYYDVDLYHLTVAFRQCVKLGLLLDDYHDVPTTTTTTAEGEEGLFLDENNVSSTTTTTSPVTMVELPRTTNGVPPTEPYSLSGITINNNKRAATISSRTELQTPPQQEEEAVESTVLLLEDRETVEREEEATVTTTSVPHNDDDCAASNNSNNDHPPNDNNNADTKRKKTKRRNGNIFRASRKWSWWGIPRRKRVLHPKEASITEEEEEDHEDDDSSLLLDDHLQSYQSTYALDPDTIAHIQADTPDVFVKLRSYFGIDEVHFQNILLRSPFLSFTTNSKGAARSKGVFFLTHDGAYLIKTIKKDEWNAFYQNMLHKYTNYMKKYGTKSLLARICGMYQVQIRTRNKKRKAADTQYIVIMNSVLPNHHRSITLTERFDLKGSTLGRMASAQDLESLGASVVYKDLDLQREVEQELLERERKEEQQQQQQQQRPEQPEGGDDQCPKTYGLHIGHIQKSAFMEQLQRDVELLEQCSVIDYSLLVGVSSSESGRVGDPDEEASSSGGSTMIPQTARSLERATRLSRRKLSTFLQKALMLHAHSSWGIDGGDFSILYGSRKGHPATYYLGVIDFLQPYDNQKALEYRAKSLLYDPTTFSCIPPDLYARRFLDFMETHIT